MNQSTYSTDQFEQDLQQLRDACSPDRHVSIVCFIQANSADCSSSPSFAKPAYAFQQLPDKPRFLLSLFLHVLYDQAIHYAVPEAHSVFDARYRCLKLHGIFGSYDNNIHPFFLLAAASEYANTSDPETLRDEFIDLSHQADEKFADFLRRSFPNANYYEPLAEALINAVSKVESEQVIQHHAHQLHGKPDVKLYSDWIKSLIEIVDP